MSESDDTVAHSPLGPSSAERWMNCPGSVSFTEGMSDTTSFFAAEGTAAHEVSDWARKQGQKANAFIGQKIEVEGYEFVVDDAMARYVQQFVDYCEQWPGEGFYEERVHYTAWVPDGWGTADDIRIVEIEGLCRLTDLKYGKGIKVYAKSNTQLMMYALGVLQDFGHMYDLKKFILAIHQPRLDHIDEFEISVKDLLLWANEIVRPAAEEATGGSTTFRAGPWCRFCRGKNQCEARANEYIGDFESLEDSNVIPAYKLAEMLSKVPDIKAWCADIESRAMSMVQSGEKVGEYKLVSGRSYRKWKDEKTAEKALRKVSKLKVADILPQKLVSPAQAEKLLGKKHPILSELVNQGPGKPVLVPGTDPRPPLQAEAADEFDSLD